MYSTREDDILLHLMLRAREYTYESRRINEYEEEKRKEKKRKEKKMIASGSTHMKLS
jgi:hypothetical protein